METFSTSDSVSTERSTTQSPPSTMVPSQRHSPIGAEGSDVDNFEVDDAGEGDVGDDDDEAAWDSWGDPDDGEKPAAPPKEDPPAAAAAPRPSQSAFPGKKFVDADLTMMDIKVSRGGGGAREAGPDFFSDMEPVIPKAKNLLEQMAEEEQRALLNREEALPENKFSALSVAADDGGDAGEGWGSEGDWGDDV